MAPQPFKIGILGTGNMGRALGIRLSQLGHPTYFSGRASSTTAAHAASLAQSLSPSVQISHGTPDDAAVASDVLIWTMRERDPAAVMSANGIAALKGKLVIDLNNRDFAEDVAGPEGISLFGESLGEQLQRNLPGAHVMKAFNTVAMETLDTSVEKLRAAEAQIWVAGMKPPSDVRGQAVALVEEMGFEVADLGDGKTPMRMAEALADALRWMLIERSSGLVYVGLKKLPSPDLGAIGERQASKYH